VQVDNWGGNIQAGFAGPRHRPAPADGRHPLAPLHGEDDARRPTRCGNVDRLLRGVDVLIHLAGTSVERPCPIIENNLVGLMRYTRARRHGVKRIVFASSNHAIGMHETSRRLDLTAISAPTASAEQDVGGGMAPLLGQARRQASACASAARSKPTEPAISHVVPDDFRSS
jgi:uronate dehydrogenase